jgi:hypothetical protein
MNIIKVNVLRLKLKVFRAVFWVILPCKMIVDRRFRGTYCLHRPCPRRQLWTSNEVVYVIPIIGLFSKHNGRSVFDDQKLFQESNVRFWFDPRQSQRILFWPVCPDQLWIPASLLSVGYRWYFPGGKARPGRDADHSPHLVPRSRMSRSYTTSPKAPP